MMSMLFIGGIVIIIAAVGLLMWPSAQEEQQEIQEVQNSQEIPKAQTIPEMPAPSINSSLNTQIAVAFLVVLAAAVYVFYNPLPGRWTAVFPNDTVNKNTQLIRKVALNFDKDNKMTYSISWASVDSGKEVSPEGHVSYHSGNSSGETVMKGTYAVYAFRVYVDIPVNVTSENADFPPFIFDKAEKDSQGKMTMKLWAPIRFGSGQLILEGDPAGKAVHFSKSNEGAENQFALEFHDGGARGRSVRNTRQSVKQVSYEYSGPPDPLMDLKAAVTLGDKEKVAQYLAHGINVDSKDSQGITLLMRAVTSGKIEVAELLLSKGADVRAQNGAGKTVLSQAIFRGSREMIEMLIAKGANINAQEFSRGRTALMDAVVYNKKEVVALLILKGADVNIQTDRGETALSLAQGENNADIIPMLQQAGAR